MEILRQVAYLAEKTRTRVYMVGGSVRDSLLNNPVRDFDLVLPGEVYNFARRVADEFHGSMAIIGRKFQTTRVVFPEKQTSFDFSSMQGNTIEEDLSQRDFTVNALAWEIQDVVAGNADAIIDPFNGRADLQAGIIRMVQENSLEADPLRVVRAVRLSIQYRWKIEENTERKMRETAPLLERVAGERLRDEIFKILSFAGSSGYMQYLDELNIRPFLGVPDLREGARGDVLLQEIEKYLATPDLFGAELAEKYQNYMDEELVVERRRRQLLKLIAFTLAGITWPPEKKTKGSLKLTGMFNRLKLSNAEKRVASRIVPGLTDLGRLAAKEEKSPLDIYRFFREYKGAELEIILLARAILACQGACEEENVKFVTQLGTIFLSHDPLCFPPRLLTGEDIKNTFPEIPDWRIGTLLEKVYEAQVQGQVKDRETALYLVRKYAGLK